MKQYTFIRTGGDKKHIEAMSLKKAIKKYDGKPNDHDNNVLIVWTSKKGNVSNQMLRLPYVSRKERKGKLWGQDTEVR